MALLNAHIIEVHTIKGEILGSDNEDEVELNLRIDSADDDDENFEEEDFDLEILEQRMEVEGLFKIH